MPVSDFSTIEVMYLSFRRSQDALLALGFFVLMVVVVFSTLLYVHSLSSLCIPHSFEYVKVFYRARYVGRDP